MFDPEPGAITHSALLGETIVTWFSDIDGVLGSGLSCYPALSIGTHQIRVEATDPFGAIGSDHVSINVVNAPPSVRIIYPEDGSTYSSSQRVELYGSVTDPDGEPIPQSSIKWISSEEEDPIAFGSQAWVILDPGEHTIAITAKDAHGATDLHDITVNIISKIGIPTAWILSPRYNIHVDNNALIHLRGIATDPEDGYMPGSSISWYSDVDGRLGSGNALDVVLSGPIGGLGFVRHTLRLEAVDSDGNVGTHKRIVHVGRPG